MSWPPADPDRLGRFDETAITWDTSQPWLDKRAAEIAGRMAGHGYPVCRKDKPFRVIISHDVDRTTGLETTLLAHSFLQSLGWRRGKWPSPLKALAHRSFVSNIDRSWTSSWPAALGPISHDVRAYGIGRYGTRTDIRWPSSRRIARAIQQAGMKIGLHGSYSSREHDSHAEEKDRLEQVLGPIGDLPPQPLSAVRFESPLEPVGGGGIPIRLQSGLCVADGFPHRLRRSSSHVRFAEQYTFDGSLRAAFVHGLVWVLAKCRSR